MSRQTVNDLTADTRVGLPVTGEDADVADVVLGWPYRPTTVLPQRWAVSAWGEACWTYMAMWTPTALHRLTSRTPNVAVFFQELGESLQRELQKPPTLNEWWRTLPAQRPTQPEIEADPVTAVPPERRTPAALPPPKSAVPTAFHQTVTAPTAHQAMAQRLKEITGATFHALTVLETAQHDTIRLLLTDKQLHRFSEQLLELGPADTDIIQAQQDLADLTSLSEAAVSRWDKAAAAWCATLSIRYQAPTTLTEPLAQAVMQALLAEPVPATRLPAVPCDLLDPVTRLPAISQVLPAVPDHRLDSFVDLRRDR